MMEFPFYSSAWFLLVFVAFGLISTLIVIYEWRKAEEKEAKDKFALLLGSFIAPIFLLFGLLTSFWTFKAIHSFRNIDVSQVKGLKIIKSIDEYDRDNSLQITINDTNSIQAALKSLKNCRETYRNHASYQDGYKLKFLFIDEVSDPEYYISVYRKSNNKEGKSVVIPHFYENKNLNLGEYDCPQFQAWVRNNIDPLFEKNLSE